MKNIDYFISTCESQMIPAEEGLGLISLGIFATLIGASMISFKHENKKAAKKSKAARDEYFTKHNIDPNDKKKVDTYIHKVSEDVIKDIMNGINKCKSDSKFNTELDQKIKSLKTEFKKPDNEEIDEEEKENIDRFDYKLNPWIDSDRERVYFIKNSNFYNLSIIVSWRLYYEVAENLVKALRIKYKEQIEGSLISISLTDEDDTALGIIVYMD